MKFPRYLVLAALFALPALAHAHPGHDGDHDLVWDFGHLLSHPLATLAYIPLLVMAGFGIRALLISRRSRKAERVKRD